ncbi:MAG: hypothetical protein KAI24_18835 [Planctomycetes bacterium]|nr:hypothetical protein [Planctomycetota bacterium]
MMLLGELVSTNTSGQTYEGFWMPAGGNDGVAAVEVFLLSGSGDYKVTLETKKSDEADTGAGSVGTQSITGTGVVKFDITNAQDLVRYVVEQTAGEGGAYMHIQFSQPLWSPN